ncbi:MAG: GNAT family N-acetyltransferase [Actinobacteria bacterium]|nr:GNAT family N-acetyltransferase [Actinomycetota bacterium]
MDLELRRAVPADFTALRAIAAAGGSPDGDDRYFAFVGSIGTLMVATVDRLVVGFAGVVPVRGSAMVSDLFVDPAHRAHGVGRRLLRSVLDDHASRLTFSSTHPAALRLYAEFGMVADERLVTMDGVAVGGSAPLMPGSWQHDRPEVIDHFRRSGAVITNHSVVRVGVGDVEVWRVDGHEPERALSDVIAAGAPGDRISLSMLESHPLVSWLQRQGFHETDHDIWCRTPSVTRTTMVSCVHRGLG